MDAFPCVAAWLYPNKLAMWFECTIHGTLGGSVQGTMASVSDNEPRLNKDSAQRPFPDEPITTRDSRSNRQMMTCTPCGLRIALVYLAGLGDRHAETTAILAPFEVGDALRVNHDSAADPHLIAPASIGLARNGTGLPAFAGSKLL